MLLEKRKKNMKSSKNEILIVEAHAKAVLARANKPLGTDRAPYMTVAYSAKGRYECETVQGCRDYLFAAEILAWK